MIAVVPEPPLLVPELATGATAETEPLRSAARAAAGALAAAAQEWTVVGADAGGRRSVGPATRGSFVGFGADVVVGMSRDADGDVDPALPLPLLVAAWLGAVHGVTLRGELVAPDAAPRDCVELGTELGRRDGGLLVVGDGSAKHTERAPGHLDERSAAFDDQVAAALAAADVDALAGLDADLAAELWASGRAPWQVLAGAAGGGWQGELLYSGAPFGVGYHVAVWRR
ncbi:hypothetical protein ACQEVB_20480 [Pseudonocardia sp. CA-107938]|uniref:hypothetical protein n=1 Tax=Pseudonocardia sp. CA-107938 TaxID=3240021 RepID=UPI003D8A302F